MTEDQKMYRQLALEDATNNDDAIVVAGAFMSAAIGILEEQGISGDDIIRVAREMINLRGIVLEHMKQKLNEGKQNNGN